MSQKKIRFTPQEWHQIVGAWDRIMHDTVLGSQEDAEKRRSIQARLHEVYGQVLGSDKDIIVSAGSVASESSEKLPYQVEWEVESGPDYIRRAVFEHEGFIVKVMLVIDKDYEWGINDFRGSFTDEFEEGAIKNPAYIPTGIKWYVPTISIEERVKDLLEDHSEEEARKIALQQVTEDARIAADPESEGFIAIGTMATVFFRGAEMGASSLWGTEIESVNLETNPYVMELVKDEVDEALRLAEAKLAAIREQ